MWKRSSGKREQSGIAKRLKQAGMRWETETAQYLLTLKSKYESGRWEKDVVTFFSDHIKRMK